MENFILMQIAELVCDYGEACKSEENMLFLIEISISDGSRLKQGEEILRRWSRHDADRHIIWCMNAFSVEIEHSISLETRRFR